MIRRAVLLLALGVLTMGCAAGGRFVASPAEWSAYRATRVAPTLEGRLVAARRYLEGYPKGIFAADVRAWFPAAEAAWYAERRTSVAGLYAYLVALPQGPHAAEAQQRIYQRANARDPNDPRSIDARIARAAARRAAAREEILSWVNDFLTPDVWQRPLTEAPRELIVRWSLGLPAPVCRLDDATGERRCSKVLELPYVVSTGEGTEEREAVVEVSLLEDAQGRPREVTLGSADLFLRLEETVNGRALAHDDGAARTAGVSRAVELLGRAFDSRVSDAPSCRRRGKTPVMLHLSCGGVRLRVEASLDGAEDDRIVIGPEPAR
jgi:hypothetical protein